LARHLNYKWKKLLLHTIHFNGFIPGNKLREFEQSIRLVSARLNKDEYKLTMTSDMMVEDHYIVEIEAKNKQEALKFVESDPFQTIEGCFRALGYLKEKLLTESNSLNKESL
jgi:hypothetical protein